MDEVTRLCDLNIDLYRCISSNIRTKEVVITEERIEHIRKHHPNDYERYARYMVEVIRNPGYILESDMPHTAFLLKQFIADNKKFQLILRLSVAGDNPNYKNSVITFLHISDRTWKKYLRNKKILYKSE